MATAPGECPLSEDIRWKQRFDNYRRALQTLRRGVELAATRELAWNVLKDYLEDAGVSGIIGSKGATREAFRNGLIENGDVWMTMILDRNRFSHTYNLEIAEEIAARILTEYFPELRKMATRFNTILEESGSA